MVTIFLCAISFPNKVEAQTKKQPVDYVNPYMGIISPLPVTTFPTVHLPNSMLRMVSKRHYFTNVLLKGLPVLLTIHR